MFDKLLKYFKEDPRNVGSVQMAVPMGFTGQGCIWYANKIPAGWLPCQNQLVNKSDYPELWNLLGDTWGASSSSQFYLPDGRRFLVGVGAAPFNTIGNKGGADEATIGVTHLPPHAHQTNFYRVDSEASGWGLVGSTGFGGRVAVTANGGSWTTNTGNGTPLPIIPRYSTIHYIIKT